MSTLPHITIPDMTQLQQQLQHVYWVGGSSGAGKSTIAVRIAQQYDMYYYATDDVMGAHGIRSTAQACPLLHRFMAMDMDERWLKRSPQVMLESFHWFHGEAFSMIINDLLSMPRDRRIIAEGLRLLPELVAPLLARPNQAVWLLPAPTFREAVFASRGGSSWSFLAKTSDPEQALHNLLERDGMFTEQLRNDIAQLQLQSINVDSTLTADELTQRVMVLFEL